MPRKRKPKRRITGERGKRLIKSFEGLYKEAYLCPAGVPTIGWGTTVYPDGTKVRLGDTCTEEEAETYLSHDLETHEKSVDRFVEVVITQHMFDALVSFVYNLGEGNFRASTLLRMLNDGKYEAAAAQFVRWNKARVRGKLVPLRGLTRRREAERDLFLLRDNIA